MNSRISHIYFSPSDVRVLKYDNYNNEAGGFKYEVEQSDGSKSQAQGNVVKVVTEGKEVDILVIKGSYSFVIDGLTYTVRYVADQNGYHPNIVVEKPSQPTSPISLTSPRPPSITRRPPPPPPTTHRPPPLKFPSRNSQILKSLLGGSSGTVEEGRKRTRGVTLDSFFSLMNYTQELLKQIFL
ncbi:endocuticle structural glycoprotein SgAbd-9-like [Cydia pomonella]|uniref:endocuticle structural glycoprotein SgAbd-9-like n=1 Tax=Cydia pomonella TaxID=82600 RepID=UPI002ADE3083|nr:endocuticle structural glycoprotein SgAbd-9-like [Cydia pomonella]